MKMIRLVFLMSIAALVSACGAPQVSRNATIDAPRSGGATFTGQELASFMPNAKINKIIVDVPRSLEVSEKNSYYPRADIVWRGELIGDRHAQVQTLILESARKMANSLDGTRPVDMHIRLTRFHGLTEKARYLTGGVHNINFVLTLLDPATGTPLRGPKEIVTNLDAFGGVDAIEADRRGETQKVRISAFIEHVLKQEITQPRGYIDTNSGFYVALNRS